MPGVDVWTYPDVSSRWIEQQQERATAALEGRSFDVLVVPAQARGQSFDATERSLMTLSLAQAIETRSDLSVADPVLVAQALGLHERTFDAETIATLAKSLGVKRIVVFDVTHNGQQRFRVRSRVVALGEPLSLDDTDLVEAASDVTFNEFLLPYYQFFPARDAIAKQVAGDLQEHKRRLVETSVVDFPADAESFAAPESDLMAVHYLQLAGVLGSRNLIERTRDMMFERSLVMLERLDPESTHYKLLQARALFYLNRRPTTYAVIPEPATPAELAFSELLNGNSNKLAAAIDNIESPLLTEIARIESERLRYVYDGARDSDAAQAAYEAHEVWGSLLFNAVMDENVWQEHTTVYIKDGADKLLPVDRLSLDSFFAALAAANDTPSEYKVAELGFRHADDVDRRRRNEASSFIGPRLGDLTDMLRTLYAGQIYGAISYWRSPQGQPRRSIKLADEFEPLMSGHPSYLATTGYSHTDQAKKARGAERTSLAKRGNALVRESALISKGLYDETLTSAMIPKWSFPRYVNYSRETQSLLLHASDWPWPAQGMWQGPPMVRAVTNTHCLNYTHWDINCLRRLESLYGETEEGRAWLKPIIDSIDGRFEGSRGRTRVLARYYLRSGDDEAARVVYDEAIEADSPEWAPYNAVARRHIRELEYEQALTLFESYPGFSDERVTGRVRLSNFAQDSATVFFEAGQYEQSVPLYELSASYDTGSDSSIRSEVNLNLIRGDYEAAIEGSTRRIGQYGTNVARRDLMGLAVITGANGLAQAAATGALDHLDTHLTWDGLLIVKRSEDTPLEEHLRWAVEDAAEIARKDGMLYALRYAMLAGVIDRDVPRGFPQMFEALDKRTRPKRLGDGRLLRNGKYFSGSLYVDSRLPTGPEVADIEIATSAEYGLRGIATISSGNYKAAFKALDRAAEFYHLENYLPYYALAAAKVGDTGRVDTYLARLRERELAKLAGDPEEMGLFFFGHVARAALDGIAGRYDAALQSLRLARADHIYTNHRTIYSRYLMLEIGRLLYEETGEVGYREFVLDTARRAAVTEPYMGYNHSFIAMLSPDGDERVDSLARVLVLDPQSRSIKRAKRKELKAAREKADNGYPMPLNMLQSEAVAFAHDAQRPQG